MMGCAQSEIVKYMTPAQVDSVTGSPSLPTLTQKRSMERLCLWRNAVYING